MTVARGNRTPAQRVAGWCLGAAYAVVGAVAAAAMLPGALLGHSRSRERLGRWMPRRGEGPWLWMQAASVGEVDLAVALARRLRSARPGLRVVVSTNTAGGRSRVPREDGFEARWFPIDFPPCLHAVLRGGPPLAFVAIETELWPATLRVLARRGIPAAVANARISDRTFPRYLRLGALVAPAVASLARVLARDADAASRWLALGARPEAVTVAGNLKFDLAQQGGKGGTAQPLLVPDDRHVVFLAASTHPGEEEMVLASLRAFAAAGGLRLVLAPRHVERAEAVEALVCGAGLRAQRWSRRAQPAGGGEQAWPDGVDVIVLDELGLLAPAYEAAQAAFVGGSLVPGPGGHNLLEAARSGARVAAGPHLANVSDQRDFVQEHGSLCVVADASALAAFWGEAAAKVFEDDRFARRHSVQRALEGAAGALERTAAALEPLLAGNVVASHQAAASRGDAASHAGAGLHPPAARRERAASQQATPSHGTTPKPAGDA